VKEEGGPKGPPSRHARPACASVRSRISRERPDQLRLSGTDGPHERVGAPAALAMAPGCPAFVAHLEVMASHAGDLHANDDRLAFGVDVGTRDPCNRNLAGTARTNPVRSRARAARETWCRALWLRLGPRLLRSSTAPSFGCERSVLNLREVLQKQHRKPKIPLREMNAERHALKGNGGVAMTRNSSELDVGARLAGLAPPISRASRPATCIRPSRP
jgi:hypothetical protein